MNIPNPYFENVLEYGNLSVEEIFFEDFYLILFVLISKNNQRFLSDCCDIRNEQRWILSSISNDKLIALINNKITVYDAIITSTEHIIAIRDYQTRHDHFESITLDSLDILDLPAKEEFLDTDPDDYKEYISLLKPFKSSCSGESTTYNISTWHSFSPLPSALQRAISSNLGYKSNKCTNYYASAMSGKGSSASAIWS